MKNITFTDSKNRNWNYELPFLITCTVTGSVKKYTSVEYINKKIERFDGLDNLRATYVSRDAKKSAPKTAPTATVMEMVTPKPVAKQDKRGMYRNAKGHIIAKDKLDQYELVPFAAENVA